MRVDIYQREIADKVERQLSREESEAMRRRDTRIGEVWTMKNDGVAVESETGYLEVRPKSGWDMNYVNRIVTEENRDRRLVYEAQARDSGRPQAAIEKEAGRRLREQAYTKSGTNTVNSVKNPVAR
jgi:uncharacterized protein YdbL (DUF1318 family)